MRNCIELLQSDDSSFLRLDGVEPSFHKENVWIFGSLLGGVSLDRLYDANELLDQIYAARHKLNDIRQLARFVVGKCAIVLKLDGKIVVIVSASHPGVYFKKEQDRVLLFLLEKDAYSTCQLSDLNEMEVANIVLSHHGLRSPQKTLFDSVTRVMGAGVLEIDKNLKCTQNYLFLDPELRIEESDRDTYRNFTQLLEKTLDGTVSFNKESRKRLMLSGGIDSLSLLAGLIKSRKPFEAVNWPLLLGQTKLCEEVAENLKVDLEVTDYGTEQSYSSDVKKEMMLGLYQTSVNLMSFWNSASLWLKGSCNSETIYISGQNMDSLYFIDTFAPSFSATGSRYFLKLFMTAHKRFVSTALFMKLFLKLKKGKALASFIKPIALSTQEHAFPSVFSDEAYSGNDIHAQLKKYKEESLYLPFEKLVTDATGDELDSVSKFNHVVKAFKWLRFVGNTSLNYEGYEKYVGLKRNLPLLNGFLPFYLLRVKLRLVDVFSIKRYLYRYFLEFYGKSHSSLKAKHVALTEKSNFKKYFGDVLKVLNIRRPQTMAPETLNELVMLQEFFQEQLSGETRVLRGALSNKQVDEYLNALERKVLDSDFRAISKSKIMEIERFMNLEIYLRSITFQKS